MRVLLTGAAGFVGRVTLDLLSEHHEVTAFDRRPIEDWEGGIIGDVLDYEAILNVMADQEAVVNTIMAPNSSYGGDGIGFTVNVSGMYNLLEAARETGVKRFVHTSSGAVHTGYPTPPKTFLHRDLYPLKAAGPYALSKVLQEELARNFHEQHGLSVAAIRPWGIIDSEKMVTTDGTSIDGFYWGAIDRRDVASSLVCALEAKDIDYECFYVMATPGGSLATDVAYTELRLGWKPSFLFDETL